MLSLPLPQHLRDAGEQAPAPVEVGVEHDARRARLNPHDRHVMVDDVVRPYAAIAIKAPEPGETLFRIDITPLPRPLLSNGFE